MKEKVNIQEMKKDYAERRKRYGTDFDINAKSDTFTFYPATFKKCIMRYGSSFVGLKIGPDILVFYVLKSVSFKDVDNPVWTLIVYSPDLKNNISYCECDLENEAMVLKYENQKLDIKVIKRSSKPGDCAMQALLDPSLETEKLTPSSFYYNLGMDVCEGKKVQVLSYKSIATISFIRFNDGNKMRPIDIRYTLNARDPELKEAMYAISHYTTEANEYPWNIFPFNPDRVDWITDGLIYRPETFIDAEFIKEDEK